MREIELMGRKYRIKEMTYGEVLEFIENASKTIVTPTGEVKQIVNYAGSGLTLIRLCIEVEDGGRYRSMSDEEIRKLPGNVGMKLVDECFTVNNFLRQT